MATTAQPNTLSRAALAIVDGDQSQLALRIRVAFVPPQFMLPAVITVDLAVCACFNPALAPSWFGGLMEMVNNISMLSVILAGAALIRECEHGTVEHLLAMRVAPIEIMLAKLWSMAVVVLLETVARSMPQFGLLVILVLLPPNMLSGANTPRESIPYLLCELMLLASTAHLVEFAQAVQFRGAGLDVVWRPCVALLAIGTVLFALALARFGAAMGRK